ncbi:putative transmembrane protein [Burkholderia pseudomallei]|nr:putative transmembrane protein [Burkholderia pseudomallei]CAJ7043184.1 putative transmembrane protein [Burkholderia pseudomallei]
MSRFHVHLVVFFAGLAAVCWIGAGYAVSNPVALAVTLVIAAGYLAGALELRRYRQATSTLAQAVAALSEPPAALGAWLERLHPSLRHAVRVRVEGERVALPGPALTPYLVGLLVLLGMLGTLIGMVMTLRGTGAALESSTDLQAIRASLAAPVKGLGFAFGTSIAGVATSAMLGLLSALCRRERLDAAQALDAKIATTLRVHSHAHQRDETFRLLQRQADLMPTLVERLQAMMHSLEQQSAASAERQIAGQQAFLGKAEETYARLASSVGQSLTDSVAESARVAGSALQPVMETTMAGLARETAALHDALTQAVQRQLDGLSAGFETTAAHVADVWRHALADHQRSSDALAQRLHGSIDRIVESFDRRSADLLDGVRARLDATASSVSDAWRGALAQQEQANDDALAHTARDLSAQATAFEQHTAALLRAMSESHSALQATLESRDEQRLATWTDSLGSIAAKLGAEWAQTSAQAANRQQAIYDALAHTARDLSAHTQAHASATIAEISRLVQAASEAPRVAAEVVAELRQKLSDSMVRDTAMLEERNRMLATLETLLDAVNHASSEQRAAVDALVATSSALLQRVGTQFTDEIGTQTDRLGGVAAQITGSAVEIASLGDALGAAVQSFGESNDKLVAHLQRIEAALDKSLARSDEQLAYYVAQAREVIDLSMMSQKQIIEELQRVGGERASAGAAAA